jgi:glycerol-3-phosphate dehydrogenase subunit C
VKKANFQTALKVGRPVARQAREGGKAFVTSECPLAGMHIAQGIDRIAGDAVKPTLISHPIQLLALAYGIA